MGLDYKELLDKGRQLSAEIDARLEENPDDEELKEIRGFLAERLAVLLFLQTKGDCQ